MSGKKKKAVGPSLTGTLHIESSPIDLIHLREYGITQLHKLLDVSHISGKSKHLIWDEQLIGALNYIIPAKFFADMGITARSKLSMTNPNLKSECDSIIFLVYPTTENMVSISQQIINHNASHAHCNYYLLFMPRSNVLCSRALQKLGALGSLIGNISDVNIDWYPIESDLLSLNLSNCFSQLIHGDLSSLTYIANALNTLQTWFGNFPVFRAKGDFACAVVDILKRLTFESVSESESEVMDNKKKAHSHSQQICNIAECVIIDRTVDMITPCLNPQTYEGLLHKIFTISNSIIKVPKSILGKSHQNIRSKDNLISIVLNSSDPILKQIRHININYVGNLTGAMIKHIQKGYDDRLNQKTSKALNNYVKRFKNLHSDNVLVEQHIFLSDHISNVLTKSMKWKRMLEFETAVLEQKTHTSGQTSEEYIEDMIGRGDPIEDVLQFMILLSLCQGGIVAKKYDLIRKDIIQTYGLSYLLTLQLLQKFGLISRYETLRRLISMSAIHASTNYYYPWSTICKSFQLLKNERSLNLMMKKHANSNVNGSAAAHNIMTDPSILGIHDINLIGNGYAPLSARLVEAATLKNGWKSFEVQLNLLKGKTYIAQRMMKKYKSADEQKQENGEFMKNEEQENRNINGVSGDDHSSNIMSAHKTILVMFIGGITYAEISAIRMLENRPNSRWKFIIATTDIADNSKIINAFVDQGLKNRKKMKCMA